MMILRLIVKLFRRIHRTGNWKTASYEYFGLDSLPLSVSSNTEWHSTYVRCHNQPPQQKLSVTFYVLYAIIKVCCSSGFWVAKLCVWFQVVSQLSKSDLQLKKLFHICLFFTFVFGASINRKLTRTKFNLQFIIIQACASKQNILN